MARRKSKGRQVYLMREAGTGRVCASVHCTLVAPNVGVFMGGMDCLKGVLIGYSQSWFISE